MESGEKLGAVLNSVSTFEVSQSKSKHSTKKRKIVKDEKEYKVNIKRVEYSKKSQQSDVSNKKVFNFQYKPSILNILLDFSTIL